MNFGVSFLESIISDSQRNLKLKLQRGVKKNLKNYHYCDWFLWQCIPVGQQVSQSLV